MCGSNLAKKVWALGQNRIENFPPTLGCNVISRRVCVTTNHVGFFSQKKKKKLTVWARTQMLWVRVRRLLGWFFFFFFNKVTIDTQYHVVEKYDFN